MFQNSVLAVHMETLLTYKQSSFFFVCVGRGEQHTFSPIQFPRKLYHIAKHFKILNICSTLPLCSMFCSNFKAEQAFIASHIYVNNFLGSNHLPPVYYFKQAFSCFSYTNVMPSHACIYTHVNQLCAYETILQWIKLVLTNRAGFFNRRIKCIRNGKQNAKCERSPASHWCPLSHRLRFLTGEAVAGRAECVGSPQSDVPAGCHLERPTVSMGWEHAASLFLDV